MHQVLDPGAFDLDSTPVKLSYHIVVIVSLIDRVAPAGEFALEVPLEEGENEVSLQAISVMGRQETATSTVVRDSEAPTGRFEIRY